MKDSSTVQKADTRYELHFFTLAVGIIAMATGLLYMRAIMNGGLLKSPIIDSGVGIQALTAAIAAGSFALLVGLRWERIGGLLAIGLGTVIAGITWYLFPSDGQWFAIFIYASPFLIAGGLYLADWFSHRPKSS